ncbi:LD-carboxypeptidase [Hydrogenophaga sp. 5NK40-0174]
MDAAALAHHMRFAGEDQVRLEAVSRAACSGADIALISRGGYGLTRILGGLPYRVLDKAVSKGLKLVGLSDFTAMQTAMLAKTGTPSWAGPSLIEDFGAEEGVDEIAQACFDDVICGQAEGTGWRLPAKSVAALAKSVKGDVQEGVMLANRATLWGGNLSVLCSLLGTPWFPQVKGGVLFIEDVNEHPYRVERSLSQLHMAGVLKQQKAILFGSFTGFKPVAGYDRGFGLDSVMDRVRREAKVPVLAGLPFGHVRTKVMLPVGRKVDLVVQGREALMFWEHDHHSH